MKKLALIVAIGCSGLVLAQSNTMKAGLWELTPIKQVMDGVDRTDQMKASQERMQQAMANMDPEKRKQMESMMKGLGVGGAGGSGGFKMCVSPEMAAKREPVISKDNKCPPANISYSGNTATFEINCTDNGRTMTGKGTTTFSGDTILTSSNMNFSDARGSHTMQNEMKMTYLGSDCQGITPADQLVKNSKSAQ